MERGGGVRLTFTVIQSEFDTYSDLLCLNKETSAFIVRRQIVFNQRCIEKMKHYIRQTNTLQKVDKRLRANNFELEVSESAMLVVA